MLKNDMWKIFEVTGKIDAYLYCKGSKNDTETSHIESEKNEGTTFQS